VNNELKENGHMLICVNIFSLTWRDRRKPAKIASVLLRFEPGTFQI
jgi:hypothetical protein